MAKQTTWIITPSGERPLDELTRAVAAAGGTLQSSLGELGLLIVKGSAAQAGAWRGLRGVAAVEADLGVDVGPPDAGVS